MKRSNDETTPEAAASQAEPRDMVQVFVLKQADGRFYTGNLRGGLPEFSRQRDDAIELDADEAREEMAGMPQGITAVLVHEFPRKKR